MDRAYALLHVKSIDAERRMFAGIASTPELDRHGDSVDPNGCTFRNPVPLLLHHDQTQPIGTVTLTRTPKGILFEATLPKIAEPGRLKDRVDEAWHSIKAGVITGVSIGYRLLDHAIERLATGGRRLLKTEIWELSLVTIPANASTTILTVKSLDAATRPKRIATDLPHFPLAPKEAPPMETSSMPRLGDHTRDLQQKLLVLDYGCWLAELGTTQTRETATKNFLARYPQSPGAVLIRTKAAIAPGTTTDSAWGGALVTPMEAAFVALLRSASLLGRIPGLRKIPFNTKVPIQTTGSNYQWIAQNAPKPASALAFSSGVTLAPLKHAAIPVVTRELVLAAQAGFSGALIEALEADCTAFTDVSFLSPTSTAIADTRPASVTAGTTPVASTGNYPVDLASLLSAFFAGRPNVRAPVLITNAAHNAAIRSMNGGGGVGVDVIVSDAAGGITVAMDPSGIFLADDGVKVESSQEAMLQMSDSPDNPTTASTVQVSLFQTNMIGFRVERYVNWSATANSVKYLAA